MSYRSFLELKKNLQKDFSQLQSVKVALLGDSSTQFLSQAIRAVGYEKGVNVDLFESDYNQIDRQVLDPSSDLYSFNPDFVVIFK